MYKEGLYFEDVHENDELPSFNITVTRTHCVKMAGASGDFNPLHHDDEYARSVGLPSLFAMGHLHGGFLSRVVTDWAGDGKIKRYKLRFTGIVWPNDIVTCKGHVSRKYKEHGDNLVDCDLFVANQKGENVIVGEATVSFPSRSRD